MHAPATSHDPLPLTQPRSSPASVVQEGGDGDWAAVAGLPAGGGGHGRRLVRGDVPLPPRSVVGRSRVRGGAPRPFAALQTKADACRGRCLAVACCLERALPACGLFQGRVLRQCVQGVTCLQPGPQEGCPHTETVQLVRATSKHLLAQPPCASEALGGVHGATVAAMAHGQLTSLLDSCQKKRVVHAYALPMSTGHA